MSRDEQPLSAKDLLALHRKLIAAGDTEGVDRFDRSLQALVTRDADEAVSLFEQLAESEQVSDRQTAALHIGGLFVPRADVAAPVLARLLQDDEPAVRDTAYDTLNAETVQKALGPEQAAVLTHAYYNRGAATAPTNLPQPPAGPSM